MKTSYKILNSGSRKTYESLKFKPSIGSTSLEEYQKVIKAINVLRCQDLLDSPEGHYLPHNIGKLIILGNKPRVSKLYSVSRPGTRIYNHHTFGIIYRIFHKERDLLRYPELFKFKPHRINIKMPLHKHLIEETRTYFQHTDFYK